MGSAFPNGHTRATSLAWRQQQAAKGERDPEKPALREPVRGSRWQIRTCRKTQTRSSRGILERKWRINCRTGLGRGAGGWGRMHSSLWLATVCPCHLTSHSLPLLPAQGTPSSSHPSWAGALGMGRQLVPAPAVSTPAGIREETKPRDADKRIPPPLCQAAGPVLLAGTRGTAEPRLADARYLLRSRGAAWLRGHIAWVPTHSPTAISVGPETNPSPPLSFFTSLVGASQHKPHSMGSLRKQPPQSTPALQLF